MTTACAGGAYRKALVLGSNSAGRRWRERKVALLVTPETVHGAQGSAPVDLANAGSGPAGTASSRGGRLQPRCRM